MTDVNSICSWHLRDADEGAVLRLSTTLSITPITARVLAGRGITEIDEARKFLDPKLSHIPDPFEIPGMDEAVSSVAQAIASGRRIAIFGDYDVDGVTAAALLADFLGSLGCDPIVLLPERLERGYGIDGEVVERLAKEGAELIITVDNGIRATDAADRARDLGIELVVTDHHTPEGELPNARAIVNPKLIPEESSLKHLSGCGVAFMLALALRKHLRDKGVLPSPEPNLLRQLDAVALGTIADIMPLTGVNRVLASFGLDEIARGERPGLRALLESSGSWPAEVTPGTVSFRLAPRINAAGRMGSAARALELMMTDDAEKAESVARSLNRANKERQKIEERALKEAMRIIKRAETLPHGIVVHSKGWHVGVIGIVAAKLVETYGRPAVVISLDTTPARGSARSPEGMNLLEALSPCADHLVQYGGHAQAAGLALDEDKIPGFATGFEDSCGKLGKDICDRKIKLDAVVRGEEITDALVGELAKCAPFGVGNPEPVLAIEGAHVLDTRTVGNGHLKLVVSSGGRTFDAIGFGMADRTPEKSTDVNLAFTPQFNTWNGRTTIQLKLKDIATTN